MTICLDAEADDRTCSYVAFFNTTDVPTTFPMKPANLGLAGTLLLRDLWTKHETSLATEDTHPIHLPAHGYVLYRMSNLPTC